METWKLTTLHEIYKCVSNAQELNSTPEIRSCCGLPFEAPKSPPWSHFSCLTSLSLSNKNWLAVPCAPKKRRMLEYCWKKDAQPKNLSQKYPIRRPRTRIKNEKSTPTKPLRKLQDANTTGNLPQEEIAKGLKRSTPQLFRECEKFLASRFFFLTTTKAFLNNRKPFLKAGKSLWTTYQAFLWGPQ